MLDWSRFKLISFDCYGTLIDWESGILRALRPLLEKHLVQITDSAILDLYAQLESEAENGPFRNYRGILQAVIRGFGEEFDFTPDASELDVLANSIPRWRPFGDAVPALQQLKQHYKLAILSNIDDALLKKSLSQLKVEFDHVITAQQLTCYKPSDQFFRQALRRLRIPRDQVLHVAQSIYHDIVPAKRMQLSAVWVNRRKNLAGFGATPPAYAEPDLEISDLKSLAAMMTAPGK